MAKTRSKGSSQDLSASLGEHGIRLSGFWSKQAGQPGSCSPHGAEEVGPLCANLRFTELEKYNTIDSVIEWTTYLITSSGHLKKGIKNPAPRNGYEKGGLSLI